MSSSITEREDLIESYLIGNRLFKFLSVVLPTHNDYFSPEPNLTELRVRSQNQLIELLQYMEELELMIDEVEYNSYILTDLRPGQTASHNHSGSDETMTTVQNTSQSSSEGEEGIVNALSRSETLPDIPESRNSNSPESYGEDSSHARQSNHSRRSLRNDSSSSDDFAQRVAAVVAANSNDADAPGSLTRRSISSATSHTHASFPKQRSDSKSVSSYSVSEKPAPIIPNKSKVRKKKMKEPRYGVREDADQQTFVSWGNSTFGDFSDPFVTFESSYNIDLLLNDEPQVKSVEVTKPSKPQSPNTAAGPLPKLKKKPPPAIPRTLRSKLESKAPSNVAPEDNGSSNAPSDFSSDIFFALEDQSGMTGASTKNLGPPVVFKSKIEERLERAAERQREAALYDLSNYDDSSVVDFRPYGDRRLIQQFRGCIRSLLD